MQVILTEAEYRGLCAELERLKKENAELQRQIENTYAQTLRALNGASIKYWREKLNLTQAELANKSGVGVVTVRNWETGKSLPNTATAHKVVSALSATEQERKKD